MRVLAKSLLVLVLLAAVPAFARSEPPARVGRVSVISGTLAFYGPGDTEWSAAQVNFPVAAGGWFATDPQSRAEVRIGPTSINLANDSQLNFADLRDKVMQLTLTQGRVDLHLRQPAWRKGETAEIDIPRGGVWLSQPGVYDIAAGAADQPTRIMVFEGSARFVGGGVDTTVKAGDQLVLSGTDTLSAAVERAAPDEFVEWCRAHDYRNDRVAASRHVSPAMTGFEELDAYGEWNGAPEYGAVWFPKSLPADWAPYREGRWAWIEPWGWNWVDDSPWGFAPFHYGRWARVADRWGWVPGEFVADPVYAPALVAFIPPEAIEGVGGGSPIGWFPLAPGEVFWPSYTRDPTYIRSVNITNVGRTRLANVTSAIVTRPTVTDPPAQVVNQRFANRGAATVVPANAFVNSSRVAPAAVAVPSPVLQRAAVSVAPPSAVARPAGASAAAAPTPGRAAAPGQPGHSTAPAPGVAAGPPGRVPTSQTTAVALPPPTRPNFSQLAPAPRVGQAAAQKAPPAATPGPAPAAQSAPPATHPPGPPVATPGPAAAAPAAQSAPPAATPGHPPGPPAATPGPAASAPATQAIPPATTPGRPPGPPDFSRLAPARVGPRGPGQSAPQPPPAGPAGAPSGAHATPPGTPPPAPGMPPSNAQVSPRPGPAGPTPPPASAHATPPERRQPAQAGPTPPAPNANAQPPAVRGGAAVAPAPDRAAQQRAAAQAAQ